MVKLIYVKQIIVNDRWYPKFLGSQGIIIIKLLNRTLHSGMIKIEDQYLQH